MSVSRGRWVAKKSARRALAVGSLLSGSLWARRVLAPGPRVRVLTYHGFERVDRDPWHVTPEVFEAQLRWLSERGLAVSLDDVLAFARGERTLPDGAALITMDDGLSSVSTIAGPIMKRYGVPGVAFVTTSLVGVDPTPHGAPERYMTWDEVERLPELGLTVGSHAHSHVSLGRLPLEQAREEGARSRELLQQHLDQPVTSFAYPFGMRLDESPDTARVLGEMGYESVFIAQHGVIRPGADPLRLPRIKVEGGEDAWMFRLICQGGMDAWKLFDDTMYHLQRPPA
jgi:peptidoglycan/xylan/chitin deacetylase (PgdA/CDA1 family)